MGVQSVAFKSEEEVAQMKKSSGDSGAKSTSSETNPAVPVTASVSSASSPPPSQNISTSAASSRPRGRTNPNPSLTTGAANPTSVESRGVQVYDVLIMLLVAAIAVLLARRISLMQESESGSNFPTQD